MHMNLRTFTALAGVALALVAAPVVSAQESADATTSRSAARSQPSLSPGGRTQLEHRRGGDRWGNHRNGDWRHRHGDWRHRRYYPRYYPRYSSFYGYPFGYGYPYGYAAYGYPYFGSSAALYYHGYHPAPRERAYTGERTYRPDSGGSVVAQVQQELARAGYYRGRVDGVIGDGTRNAIRAYERANRLRVDGRIDSELLRSMRIG
jgi:hypothetical protein